MRGSIIGPNGKPVGIPFGDDRISFMANGGVPITFQVESGDSFSINVVVNPDKRFQLHLIGTVTGVAYTLALSEPFDDLAELLETTSELLGIMIRKE